MAAGKLELYLVEEIHPEGFEDIQRYLGAKQEEDKKESAVVTDLVVLPGLALHRNSFQNFFYHVLHVGLFFLGFCLNFCATSCDGFCQNSHYGFSELDSLFQSFCHYQHFALSSHDS